MIAILPCLFQSEGVDLKTAECSKNKIENCNAEIERKKEKFIILFVKVMLNKNDTKII